LTLLRARYDLGMTSMKRRQWLQAMGTGLLASGARSAHATTALVRDARGILDLPPGFSYRVISRVAERMRDGYRVPGHFDAMGVFEADGQLVLMRNHEVAPGEAVAGPFPAGIAAPPEAYDRQAFGGVTRLVLDRSTLELKHQELALCGTHWNCAGGLSPWGWLTCEEIFIPEHGYVFLVPHDTRGLTQARPIRGYGRFRHEAASVDPQTLIAYLTEDREDAAFYRFVPHTPDKPFEGKLQALRVRDAPAFNTSTLKLGQRVAIDWVDVPNPDPREDDVRLQARARGAASFARTEGLWLSGPELFMCATEGGPIGRGQILRLRHAGTEPELSVVAHSEDAATLDMPDNITVAPSGELFVAEDGLEGNCLRRVTRDGVVSEFARNVRSTSELSGPCFTPDGRTMFVNVQHDGLTLAIQGPFGTAAGSGSLDRPAPFAGFAGVGAGTLVIALGALMRRKQLRAGD
jgi:secreted PhoX family phosphatase